MNPSLIYHVTSSLDGYIAHPDGSLDWFDSTRQADEEYSFQYFYANIDSLLMGRMTYEALLSRSGPWPYPGKPCVVLTRCELARTASEVQLTHCTPAQAITALRGAGFQRTWLVGGGSLAGTCYAAGLIDEILINLTPHLLGAGIRLFATGIERSLELKDQRRFNNGVLQLHYQVKNQHLTAQSQSQHHAA
ncbi:Dihydrofolate reductase [Pseudomonas sp. 8Z]|uniref:dihydrofolate reductase family protein n=1 Tax=Pseudomonas sp. 8Z TaxID=2653166 RepID=UPI0012F07BA0|nr:dihydrofolate reductase family protein [Pseudomonas sp. 8Z]VXC55988.1 Dihydrofolate reductase [Pseudomonas sp. 8Z]